MADRPILFSAPMVRALIDGRKSQTRRILKDVPPAPAHDNHVHEVKHDAPYFDAYCGSRKSDLNPRGMTDHWCWWTRDDRAGHGCKVPFVPGDRLWVKETWRTISDLDDVKPKNMFASITPVEYCATGHVVNVPHRTVSFQKNRVSIFMPRWASRLTLTVTDVRVERLQDCSEADAIAEGVQWHRASPNIADIERSFYVEGASGFGSAVDAYRWLWNSINGAGAWEANPWVAAISFDVREGNIDA